MRTSTEYGRAAAGAVAGCYSVGQQGNELGPVPVIFPVSGTRLEAAGGVGMRRFVAALAVGLLVVLAGCGTAGSGAGAGHATGPAAFPVPTCATTAATITPSPATTPEVTVEQLVRLLPRHPVVVGFDVDDTLISSTPAFNALEPSYDPKVVRPKNLGELTNEQKAQYHAFWNELNEHLDDLSTPKRIGQVLLDLHVKRGDDIWIISRRQATVPPSGAVTRRLERLFNVKLAHEVVQTNLTDKTRFICERRIEYYYGDADSDVTAAIAAGATPIRVKRAAGSYAKDRPRDGELGEIVIQGSEQ